ncbi:unnamed protein product [Taenia asiatica]|uniref:Reverse transcriptase domain-containing protein n=1 Tax=Taenia asiatica TaxID=60517 RepID=A0A0R3WB15_TAEAS|nr:unnamed protein product [Taenia asiatica]
MQTALIRFFPKKCIIYLDDILVFGKDMQEHNASLKPVLDRPQDAGLILTPKKCHFLQRSVTFLKHTVSSGGLAINEDQGRERVIAYVNVRLEKKKRQKIATEPELFAILTMDRHLKHYLISKQLIVRTDHQALTWLRRMKDIDRSVARWHEKLQQYAFTVQYRKATKHSNADVLSCRSLSRM